MLIRSYGSSHALLGTTGPEERKYQLVMMPAAQNMTIIYTVHSTEFTTALASPVIFMWDSRFQDPGLYLFHLKGLLQSTLCISD